VEKERLTKKLDGPSSRVARHQEGYARGKTKVH